MADSHGFTFVAPRPVGLALTLASALVVAGCRPSPERAASEATISVGDGGAAEIVFGGRRADLPPNDVGKDTPAVVQDASGRRLAYAAASGSDRTVYVVGDGLFVGPLVSHPADFRAVQDLEHAWGALFESAGPRRKKLLDEARRERGEPGVVQLLVAGAHVDDPAWEEATKTLGPDGGAAVREAVKVGLERGKPGVLLRRAIRLVDLEAPAQAKLVAARVEELIDTAEEPRAASALLRVVVRTDKAKAATLGCAALAKRPSATNDEWDKLAEAAALAVVAAGAACPSPDDLASVVTNACLPYYRCGPSGPLAWSDPSDQNEPLCTKEELAKVISAEASRSTADVLDSSGARPGLFAYAALLHADRVPEAFALAHARRRFAIVEPTSPSCDSGLAAGTACHCAEATLRAAACRSGTSPVVNGLCRFDVNVAEKKILNVVAEPNGS